ncbi:EamA family transporter [Capnocytophaga sp. oral taxon 324]|uniref:EamA family transporter n=1 Tax=Capnocytophaga sp. oral taxon 324 TaxID=712211 RepID=UPI0002A40439|nr:EamA family transporter [Capnocytophaga sp. oral taxon 324]EKY17609.1 putative membrane protein [Capnocytophaga sp. oral taxon 324 str. F0483]
MWLIYALLSAVFAALTSILAKIGIEGVNSNLATAIRTLVVVALAWVMVFLTQQDSGLAHISKKSWLFLILSGLATGFSWLCYYKALQMGVVSKVVAVDKISIVLTFILAVCFLHEAFTLKSLIGIVLIAIGTLVMVI